MDGESAAERKQHEVDALLSDAFRESAGGETSTSRAQFYRYNKVRAELPVVCFLSGRRIPTKTNPW